MLLVLSCYALLFCCPKRITELLSFSVGSVGHALDTFDLYFCLPFRIFLSGALTMAAMVYNLQHGAFTLSQHEHVLAVPMWALGFASNLILGRIG